jgi:hypothetical protein
MARPARQARRSSTAKKAAQAENKKGPITRTGEFIGFFDRNRRMR